MNKFFLISIFTLAGFLLQAQQLLIDKQPVVWLESANEIDSLHWSDWRLNGLEASWNNLTPLNITAINFQDAVFVDQNNGPLFIPYNPKKKGNLKMYVVYHIEDTIYENGIWTMKFDSTKRIGLTSQRILGAYKDIRYSQTTQPDLYINALTQSWKNEKPDTTISGIQIGGTDSLQFFGKIAEVMYFDTKPGARDNEKIHTYLAVKYGITLNRINYLSSQNEVVWNTKKEVAFTNDVAALGRDDLIMINQRQSAGQGGASELTMFLGSLEEKNANNPFTINDYNYIVWGHNGKPINEVEMDTGGQLPISNILNRKWKVKVTGAQFPFLPVNIKFNGNSFDSISPLELIISRNCEGPFEFDSTDIYLPDSVDNQRNFYFSNIVWDTDFSGADLFSFRIASPSVNRQNKALQTENILEETDKNLKFGVYPNPGDGLFTVTIEPAEEEDFILEITDVTGKIVSVEEIHTDVFYTLSKQLLTQGVYFFKLSTKTQTQTQRVVVK